MLVVRLGVKIVFIDAACDSHTTYYHNADVIGILEFLSFLEVEDVQY